MWLDDGLLQDFDALRAPGFDPSAVTPAVAAFYQQTSAWHLRTSRESIRVYAAADGEVRADHVLTIWGRTFLRLHYRLRRQTP
jgi:hypothetical protein